MLQLCPATQFLEGGDHALLQYFTVHVGVHVSLNEILTCSTHAALDHDIPTTILDCRNDTRIFVPLSWSPPHMLEAIRTNQINLHLIRPKDMVPVIHVLC